MLSVGEELLRAILDNPEDDVVRLVYADWLEEHGEGERAEFIRVQVELAGLPEPEFLTVGTLGEQEDGDTCWGCYRLGLCKYHALKKREDQLVRRLGLWPFSDDGHTSLIGGAGNDLYRGKRRSIYRRGFADEIHCTCNDFLQHAGAIFSRHPVTKVVLTDAVVHPSGGNSTYYLGNLGMFPKDYWRELDGLPSHRDVLGALGRVCLSYGRRQANLLLGVPT